MEEDTQIRINELGKDFRDVADKDYIMARKLLFDGFSEGFFWHAQQCIEKYLKGIAIYQKINISKKIHDLKDLYESIDSKFPFNSVNMYWKRVPIKVEESFSDFLNRFKNIGLAVRYPTSSYGSYPDELMKVDATVFIIRRYCKIFSIPDFQKAKAVVDKGNDYSTNGYLGNILRSQSSEKKIYKECLTRCNNFFPTVVQSMEFNRLGLFSPMFKSQVQRVYEIATGGNPKDKTVFDEFTKHIWENIYLSGDVKKMINVYRKSLGLDALVTT